MDQSDIVYKIFNELSLNNVVRCSTVNKLVNLQDLNLSNNQITELPETIGQLINYAIIQKKIEYFIVRQISY